MTNQHQDSEIETFIDGMPLYRRPVLTCGEVAAAITLAALILSVLGLTLAVLP